MATLDDTLQQIGASYRASVVTPCLFPPKPWHIQAREAARCAVQHLCVTRCIPGVRPTTGYWADVNRAENWLREAIRAHRFERGNANVQTFGNVWGAAA